MTKRVTISKEKNDEYKADKEFVDFLKLLFDEGDLDKLRKLILQAYRGKDIKVEKEKHRGTFYIEPQDMPNKLIVGDAYNLVDRINIWWYNATIKSEHWAQFQAARLPAADSGDYYLVGADREDYDDYDGLLLRLNEVIKEMERYAI
jgi:hypothetical protein